MGILVTGGCGYIGSHTAVELLEQGKDVVIVDDLSNASIQVIDRIEKITGKRPAFYQLDVRNKEGLHRIFQQENIEAAIHFAAYKAVGESVHRPVQYYENNLQSILSLVEVMAEHHVKKIVFSSSATVYGSLNPFPYKEDMPVGIPTSPYGQTKVMCEQILRDVYVSDDSWSISLLRYFNPIGAHASGLIGEDPSGIPNNLMPFIAQVAVGKREFLNIFGGDYETPDGTCIRDYIHVVDLAKGHVKALEKLDEANQVYTYNLGSGKGTSVLELVNTFINVTGVAVPYQIAPRRSGDLPAFYANADKALAELGWQTEKSITDMCQDTWHWQSNNPNGYES